MAANLMAILGKSFHEFLFMLCSISEYEYIVKCRLSLYQVQSLYIKTDTGDKRNTFVLNVSNVNKYNNFCRVKQCLLLVSSHELPCVNP